MWRCAKTLVSTMLHTISIGDQTNCQWNKVVVVGLPIVAHLVHVFVNRTNRLTSYHMSLAEIGHVSLVRTGHVPSFAS